MFYSAAMIVISLYFMAMPVAGFKEVQAILNLSHKQNESCWRMLASSCSQQSMVNPQPIFPHISTYFHTLHLLVKFGN